MHTDKPSPLREGPAATLPDLRSAALHAAKNSWAVFPLYPLSKRPAVKNWERWATTDLAAIHEWWSTHPDDNVGVACGPSQLLVLDLDAATSPVPKAWQAHGVTHGRDVLALRCAEADQPDPIDTFTVETPNRGEHRYFHQPADIQLRGTTGSRGRGLGWKIDTRGHGSLVVAPGSRLQRHDKVVLYKVVRNMAPAPLPQWLVERLTPQPPPLPAPGLHHLPSRRIAAYVRAAVIKEAAKVRTAEVGERRITAFAAAAALGGLAARGWLTDTTITQAITDAARPHIGVEDFKWGELAVAIRDGIAAGRNTPRDIPKPRTTEPSPSGRP